MLKYILKRLGLSVLVLLGVSLIIYILIRLMPTDFVEKIILEMSQGGTTIPQETVDALYNTYGLGDNSFGGMISGYFGWLMNIFRFDFGTSFSLKIPVTEVIAKYMGTSFFVALVATIFEFMIAIPLGITAATHQYSVRDYITTIFVMIGISLPSFFFGEILKGVFSYNLGWFPKMGNLSPLGPSGGFGLVTDYLWHMVLPILTIVILSIGPRMRMTRTTMLEVLNADYIRTARAKGRKESKVINKHAFRNTLIPLVTTLAGLLPSLFSGAIITEQVFGLDGIGRIALDAMNDGDIPLIMGYNMFLAFLSVIGVLLSDLMYAWVDPRVKLE